MLLFIFFIIIIFFILYYSYSLLLFFFLSFIIHILYYYYFFLSFIIFIFYYFYGLLFLNFIILIFYYPNSFSSSYLSFLLFRYFPYNYLIIFITSLCSRQAKYARQVHRGGNRNRGFSPQHFGAPGRRTTPRPPGKILTLWQFQQRSPLQNEEQKPANFCKMDSSKKPKISRIVPEWQQSQRCISYFALGITHAYVFLLSICTLAFPRSFLCNNI